MLPVVAVEIAPADAPPTLADALIASCSTTLRRGACTRADTVEASAEVQATAVVVWKDEGLTVRVEVGVKRDGEPSWVVRQLSFTSSDEPIERWRAAGLTVASLVGEIETRQSAASQTPTTPTDRPKTQAPPRSAPPSTWSPPRGWLGLAMIAGTGLSPGGGVRLGGRLEGALLVLPAPVYALGSVEHAARMGGDQGLDVQWTTLGGGAAAITKVPGTDAFLGASARVVVQRVAASVQSSPDERGSQWDPGVAMGARAGWRASPHWSFAAGADGWRLWRGASIRVQDREAGRSPAWGLVGWVGLQWAADEKAPAGAW
jgi:hypothetical protein